jgi:hypothetical protein
MTLPLVRSSVSRALLVCLGLLACKEQAASEDRNCGDHLCTGGETCTSCSLDCECPAACGDGSCNGDETCTSCSEDCGFCPPTCPDGSCSGTETCSSCSADCGACPAQCGDTSCAGDETCLTCSFDCGACTPTSPPVYGAAHRSITVDGALGDWSGVESIALSESSGRGTRDNRAVITLAWDATYLYAAYDVSDTELATVATLRDGDVYKDDAVELYVDTRRDGGSAMQTDDFQFLVSAANIIKDLQGTGTGKTASWNAPDLLTAVQTKGALNDGVADEGYVIELAIPWRTIGASASAGQVVGIDVAMDDRDTGDANQTVDWARLSPYSNPNGWPGVRLLGP